MDPSLSTAVVVDRSEVPKKLTYTYVSRGYGQGTMLWPQDSFVVATR